MKDPERVLITGAGAVCGAGLGVDAIWQAVLKGRSAIGEVTSWETRGWPAIRGAEVRGVDNRTLVEDRKLHKLISRTDLFGLYAANEAIQSSGVLEFRAGLTEAGVAGFNDRSGVFAGSGGGNYRSNYDFFPLLSTAQGDLARFGRDLGDSVNPMWLLRILPNNVVCHVGIRHNFKGTNACITNQAVGGALALLEAAESLRADEADRAVAVAHDTPLEPETALHFHRLGLASSEMLRPFDARRSGTVLGEGGAAVMLEKLADARARNAPILGEFLGAGCVTEGTGVLEIRPDGAGLAAAIEIALEDAGVAPGAVGVVVAHGNGTLASDASEAIALRRVFGNALPPITAFKWAFGHLIAASGMLDAILALRGLKEGVVPGIPTLQSLDPQFGEFPVSTGMQSPRSRVALVLSRGFGGMNVALVMGLGGGPDAT
jgi:3-oxoacyl-[acyl-carrier-protein] synthase-1